VCLALAPLLTRWMHEENVPAGDKATDEVEVSPVRAEAM
jgi:hypothetical protein